MCYIRLLILLFYHSFDIFLHILLIFMKLLGIQLEKRVLTKNKKDHEDWSPTPVAPCGRSRTTVRMYASAMASSTDFAQATFRF